MNRKSRTLSVALLAALLAAGVLLPPELQPVGLAFESILTALLLVSLAWEDPASLDPSAWRLPLLAGGALLPCLLLSYQAHTSLGVLFHLIPAAAAFVAARRLSGLGSQRESIQKILIGLSGLVGLWGVFQSVFSLSRTARYLRSLGNRELDPMILRAESGRAFGPFLLPADLGIFLAMALPLTFAWLSREKRAGARAWVGLILAAQIAGLAACRSYGGILSLLASGLLLVSLSRIRGKGRWAWALAVTGGLAMTGVFLVRGSEGLTPVGLRLENWRLAWKVFTSHPIFGTGPGNLGDAVTLFQRPEVNETVYAHNSYLQIAAEGGLTAACLLAAVLGILLKKLVVGLKQGPDPRGRLLECLPVAAFLMHNVFDFSAYLPSLLLPFATLSAFAIRRPAPRPARAGLAGRRIPIGATALVALVVALLFWGLREARTASLLQAAHWDLQEGNRGAAAQAARAAAQLNPEHPDPPAVLAEIGLAELDDRAGSAEEGERWARQSVALRPQRAYGHYVLSLYRLSRGDLGESFVELSCARRLYPRKEIYRLQEVRLREMISSSAARGEAAHGG